MQPSPSFYNRYGAYGFLILAVLLLLAKPLNIEFLLRPAEFFILPFADAINWFFIVLKEDLGFHVLTRAFAAATEWLIDITSNLLYGKRRWPRLEPIPWSVVAITAAFIGYYLNGWRMAALAGGTFLWIALMGQWKWAMETLSVIIVATPIAVLLGLSLGIVAWKSKRFETILNPILNIAQSLPHFSYMIPVVVFVGVGPKAGAIVTVIFATPPMIRMSLLGLKKVPPEIIESGIMSGTNRWQMLFKVLLPSARTELIVGVNQVIMQCLAMVVLASFIGMPGLGYKLLQLLQSLKIGRSVEIGITIVLIAVMLDRCSKAWAYKLPQHFEKNTSWFVKHKILVCWAVAASVFFVLAQIFPLLDIIGRRQAFSMAKELDFMMDQLFYVIDPISTALRGFLIVNVLVPIRDFYLWLPYLSVIAIVSALAFRIGGMRSVAVCFAFIFLIAMSGWWDRAMITAYMISFSVFLACIMGFPLGLWATRNDSRANRILLICDTAQTFPSFIYLIPVVMLFGVNDVAAIAAIVIFATVPITRYTIEGLRSVPEAFLEAADMAGASKRQSLWFVRLPMALPVLMVGLNQSIMFSLFMVIIAAFIGTQDLGQEMQRALSFTDVGKGMVLGLCVAFMGLAADHLILRWSEERKKLLGLM